MYLITMCMTNFRQCYKLFRVSLGLLEIRIGFGLRTPLVNKVLPLPLFPPGIWIFVLLLGTAFLWFAIPDTPTIQWLFCFSSWINFGRLLYKNTVNIPVRPLLTDCLKWLSESLWCCCFLLDYRQKTSVSIIPINAFLPGATGSHFEDSNDVQREEISMHFQEQLDYIEPLQ